MPAHTDDKPLRVAMLLSGSGTTLRNLVDRIADGRLRAVRIAQVVSSRRQAGGVEIATRAGLPLAIVRRKDFATDADFSAALADGLDRADVDLVLMGGFLCHWPPPPRYVGRVLNIHPSLLPAFGGKGMIGLRVHEAVLEAGVRQSGCTVHLVDELYDHGPIVAQRVLDVARDDTPQSLCERVRALEFELYPAVLERVVADGVAVLAEMAHAHAHARP
ncbi:MAG: phosphoribosylglycinamide formyltransferase [Phycisphaerae bacterium]